MDVNNMKVTDLKKELKSRGLSIVGNKRELTARLESVLTEGNSQTINDNDDSVLNEEDDGLLGSDLLDGDGSEDDPKEDESLIDDLLDSNENNNLITTKPKTQTTIPVKRVTAAVALTSAKDNSKDINNDINSNNKSNEDLTKDKTLLKISNTITLTNNEKKELRAQKFGDNKLTERARRFGLSANNGSTEAKAVTKTDSSNTNEMLRKRAQRFGTIVSDKMKKIDANEKLLKRKERFGAIVSKTSVTVSPNPKRAITFSTKDDDRKKQRLERFSIKS